MKWVLLVVLFVGLVACETDVNFFFANMLGNGGHSGGDDHNPPSPQELDCSFMGSYANFVGAIQDAVCGAIGTPCAATGASGSPNSGFGLNMWATIVNRYGRVCAVGYSGPTSLSQWPGSRVISAQKANTGNSFSLDFLALSSANLYQATQPGGTLWGLLDSNLLDTEVAYGGDSVNYGNACGTSSGDPMCGKKAGGLIVFGGGLALYNSNGKIVGGLGVSGDTSCTDHFVAWKIRHLMNLDYVTGGPIAGNYDNINFYYPNGTAPATGWAQPICFPGDPAFAEALVTGTYAPRTPVAGRK